MANFYREPDRRQRFLLPVDMSDWVSETDMVHLLLDAIELMDLSAFEAHYTRRGTGAPPFSPSMMVCVLIYAYANGHRSSRKIERLCERDAGFRMIVGDEVPDHSVIARFRKRHRSAFEALFAEVLKRRTSLPSLIEALFYDLSPGDRAQVKIPKQAERRERDLRDLMKKGKRPVVLVVDEAHDLHHKTLTGLKRLMEVVADAGVLLSALLVGHPRLRNDLRRPQMEEIGYRTTTFDYEGIGAARRDYVTWLLGACAAEGVKVADLMDEDAIDLIADRLRTPLQIEMHLTLAFEQGFVMDAKPVTVEIVEKVLSRAIDDLEPTLTRNGYDAHSLVGQLNARLSDVRAFLAGTLDPERTQELTEQLRAAGVPL